MSCIYGHRCEHTVRVMGRQYQCDDICDGNHANDEYLCSSHRPEATA